MKCNECDDTFNREAIDPMVFVGGKRIFKRIWTHACEWIGLKKNISQRWVWNLKPTFSIHPTGMTWFSHYTPTTTVNSPFWKPYRTIFPDVSKFPKIFPRFWQFSGFPHFSLGFRQDFPHHVPPPVPGPRSPSPRRGTVSPRRVQMPL